MSVPDGIVVSRSPIPRTLGFLHIIFGTLLILFGACTLGFTLAAPSLGTTFTQITSQQNQAIQARHEARLKSLEDQEKAANDEETKATLKAERDALAASPPIKPIQPDFSALDQFKNPTILYAAIAEKLTGIALNVALIVAGIGLVRTREWGRRLGVQIAAVQLVRLAIFTVVCLAMVIPAQRVETEKMLGRMEDLIKQGTAPPTAASTIQMSRATLPAAPYLAAGYFMLAAVYPIVCLILLQTRGARAACLPMQSKPVVDAGDLS